MKKCSTKSKVLIRRNINMAMNPMQRKLRNSFLFGFLVALIIGGVAIGLLIMKNKKTQEELVKVQQANKIALKTVYVAKKDIGKNENVSLVPASVPSQYAPKNAITSENVGNYLLKNEDENGEEVDPPDPEEEPEQYAMIAKVAIKENTILTEDLVERSAEASTYRLVEYNMISLPSKLQEGEYIDIRLACLGYDCVVLSKVKVQSCDNTTIWLKLSESQLLTLNYAIIESYIMQGTKLYATQYANSAQAGLNPTYVPDDNVMNLIKSNLTKDSEEWKLFMEESEDNSSALAFRNEIIYSLRGESFSEDDVDAIEEGYTAETTNTQAARDALMGDLGY